MSANQPLARRMLKADKNKILPAMERGQKPANASKNLPSIRAT
jgi:hypothetical protein